VLSAACAGGDAPSGAGDAGPAAAPFRSELIGERSPPIDRFQLTVQSPGAEPRRVLRYRIPPGSRQRVVTRTDVSAEVLVAGRRVDRITPPTPEVSFELEVAPRAAGHPAGVPLDQNAVGRPAGYLCTAWITGITSADWERMAPGGGSELRQSYEQLRGHHISFEIDDRGVPGARSIALPESLENNRMEALQVLRSIDGAVVPLPAEPVGVGATWSVSVVEPGRSPLAGPITHAYTLVAMRGTELEVTMTYGLPTEPSPLQFRAVEVAGYRSSVSEGSYKVSLDLRRLMPDIQGAITTDIEGRSYVGSEELPFKAVNVVSQRMRSSR
jgi:hypothetical protein